MKTASSNPIKTHRIFASLLAWLLAFASARAADITWTNTAGGNWNAAANWSPNQVPGSNDHALTTADGTYTVTVNTAVTIAQLTLGATSGTQTLANNTSGALTLTGTGQVLASGVLRRSASTFSCTGALTVHGRVE
jgi:Flp pilus assembly protein TadG